MHLDHLCLQACKLQLSGRRQIENHVQKHVAIKQFEGRKLSLNVKDLLVIVVVIICFLDASFLQISVDFEGRAFQTPTSFL
jgi:hypothetical protein